MPPTVLLADPAIRLAGVRTAGRRAAVVRRRPVRWGRVLIGALLTAVVLGLAFLHTWPPLATVMSGSMAPTIDTGDVVLLKRLDRPARVGDIVSVSVPDEARTRFGYPPVVIHRIVVIARDGAITTKGDAHRTPDPFSVPSTAVTTRVFATVPAAGRIVAFLGSTLGLLWLAAGGALLLGLPLLDRYRDAQRRDMDERETLQSALEAITDELERAREARGREAEELARTRAARERETEELARTREAADRELATLAAELRRTQEARERETEALAAELARTREARDLEVAEAKHELRLVTAAFNVRLLQLPAQIERAIAEAFAAAGQVPPPPPPIAPAPPVPTPDPFARRFVAASQFTPTPDLLGALKPAPPPLPWDAPPSGAAAAKVFAT
ncbi:signal peptidase I [Solirubrobacter ginsenosidimutans]|uniref:Signal peptidase I n=1 Tax=Solirubrobacter ginsenosidimutans TaxID=490573 RepID=A0A9X3MYN8_9ACTN|nr:signal peptidase I [Solirubrobacter ginsenosidimutans]MDA0161888.1 signal peptidase I [Solirubrobacter ginsenosidimutans]